VVKKTPVISITVAFCHNTLSGICLSVQTPLWRMYAGSRSGFTGAVKNKNWRMSVKCNEFLRWHLKQWIEYHSTVALCEVTLQRIRDSVTLISRPTFVTVTITSGQSSLTTGRIAAVRVFPLQWAAPFSPQNYPSPWGSGRPSNKLTWLPEPTSVHNSNGISIGLTVFFRAHESRLWQINRPTDRQTMLLGQ